MEKLVAISFAILATSIIFSIGESRELRPSVHGLPFQASPATSPETEMFFGEEVAPPTKRPQAPIIIGNSSNPASDTWLKGAKGREEDRIRKALVVATVVCGGAGVVFLAVAVILFTVYFRRQRLVSTTLSNSAAANTNNSSAIAVASPAPPIK